LLLAITELCFVTFKESSLWKIAISEYTSVPISKDNFIVCQAPAILYLKDVMTTIMVMVWLLSLSEEDDLIIIIIIIIVVLITLLLVVIIMMAVLFVNLLAAASCCG
jgi:hypothetical protein